MNLIFVKVTLRATPFFHSQLIIPVKGGTVLSRCNSRSGSSMSPWVPGPAVSQCSMKQNLSTHFPFRCDYKDLNLLTCRSQRRSIFFSREKTLKNPMIATAVKQINAV